MKSRALIYRRPAAVARRGESDLLFLELDAPGRLWNENRRDYVTWEAVFQGRITERQRIGAARYLWRPAWAEVGCADWRYMRRLHLRRDLNMHLLPHYDLAAVAGCAALVDYETGEAI